MKKFFGGMIFLFCAMFAFSAPSAEVNNEIVVLHSGDTVIGNSTLFTMAEASLKKDFPDAKVTWLKIDLSDGSAITMDAMLAAGTTPNVYIDTMVRASKYMVPEFALPLDNYIRDLNKYNPGVFDPYRKNGKLMALPNPGGAQGMLVNLNIMKEINYTVPDDWTIQDFLHMAELVKQKYGGTKWATGMFAANQSGDYLLNAWFASFGVKFYESGNYDQAVIAKTGGAKVFRFYQDLVNSGYVPPNASTLNDDDYCAQWMVGDIAATAFFPSWTKPYFDTAISSKQISEPFDYVFVPFPRAPGVTKVPTYYSNGAFVVRNTGTNIDNIASRLVEYINSAELQGAMARVTGVIPNRIDATAKPSDPHVQEVMAIVQKYGLQDVGLTDPRFTERRALQFPILQQVLTFKLTPDEAIKLYEQKLSNVR